MRFYRKGLIIHALKQYAILFRTDGFFPMSQSGSILNNILYKVDEANKHNIDINFLSGPHSKH